MTDSSKRRVRSRGNPGSLLSPDSTGGITAGKGLDFQTRYAVCHLPGWLEEGTFHQLFYEGTGDIDVRFMDKGQSARVHVQVKDHEVRPAEFKEALKKFRELDSTHPGLYQRFTFACPSLSASLRSIETALARFRSAKPFYDDAPSALAPTKEDFIKRLNQAGLKDYADFIESRVYIDVGHESMCRDDRAVELFIARMLKHPSYANKLRAMVEPAFAQMIRALSASRGTVLDRGALEAMLAAAVVRGETGGKGIIVAVQNWMKETFDPAPDYGLDWSAQFDRETRRVPTQGAWNRVLVPELRSLQRQIVAERTERFIRFRGKCALSTGIAIGTIFPTVGGWQFEVPQPPQGEWKSDAVPTHPYDIQIEVIEPTPQGTDLVVGLNIKGDGRQDVRRYVESTRTPPKAYIFVSPPSQGGQAIGGSEDACAYSRAIRDLLGTLSKRYETKRTRLFFYGPFALAVFLGQQLTSVGEVQLFEYQDPGYVPSCRLRT
jgi:hypothetical protein